MSFDLTTEDQGEKQSWLERQKKSGQGKGWGSGLVGVVVVLSGQGLGFGAGVLRFEVSGLRFGKKGIS